MSSVLTQAKHIATIDRDSDKIHKIFIFKTLYLNSFQIIILVIFSHQNIFNSDIFSPYLHC
nr:MAG TPA: hypothetical protein [Caudoviricetes sp.]